MKRNHLPAAARLLMVSAGLLLGIAHAAPPRYHVRQGGTGDGSTWALAGGDLQAAIQALAGSDGEVWVAAGTYYPTSSPNGGTFPREVHFALRKGVKVYGGFPATGTPDMPDRNPAVHLSVCSGDLGFPDDPSDNAYHVFYHPASSAPNETAVLDGFTITAGNADGGTVRGHGGGIYNEGSLPVFVRCVIRGNQANLDGGGLYELGGGSQFVHCVFHQNSSAAAGGGVYLEHSAARLANCVFAANSAASGGAVANNDRAEPRFQSCTFHGNTATASGGGIHNSNSSAPTVQNSILWGDSNGEIIDTTGSASTVETCVIQGGWTGAGGNNLDSNPLFAQSASPPGPDTLWATNDDGLRLASTSPAIDSGKRDDLPADTGDLDRDGDVTESTPFDLRMLERMALDDLDRGAYEFQRPTVTFSLAGHATRTGGGALVQQIDEGTNAVQPVIAIDLGWTFTGWDQPFTNVYTSRTVTAQYTTTFPAGGVCYVRVGGSGNGSSWALAAGNVQQAIDAVAMAGGQVWIAAGTYFPTSWPNGGSAEREKHFSLRNNVSVVGGFPPTGNPFITDRNPSLHPTILSANLGDPGNPADNAYHVFFHPGSTLTPSARLDGVVITGANADQEAGHEYGGGMFNQACSPTLLRCRFEGNYARFQGGGLYLGPATPYVVNCVFSNNSSNQGGACFLFRSNATLANCVFTGNTAVNGGGIYSYSSPGTPRIFNCTFSANTASSGGALFTTANSPVLDNCILWGDSLAEIHESVPGTATLNSCIIQGGWAGPGSNNLDSNPQFLNPADPDGADNLWATADDGLQPANTSPAINSGDQTLLPPDSADLDRDASFGEPLPLDFSMRPRVRDTQVERGAYEPLTPLVFHVRVGGTGNGLTWATSMGAVQTAIDAAFIAGNSQVWIAEGTYLPTSWPNGGGAPRERHFSLRNGVPVLGGFHSSGDPGLAERDPAAHPVILSGDLDTPGSNTDNAYHVFYHPGSTLNATARLDGVTITAGNANGGGGHSYGAGMFESGGSPTIVRCIFLSNSSANQAGGLYLGNSSSSVVNCVFANNSASQQGGGLYVYQSTATVANCMFATNNAQDGAGVFAYLGGLSVFKSCTFAGNTASTLGGAFYNSASQAELDNCILWGNTVGTIFELGGTLVLHRCIVQGGWSGPGSNNTSADPLFANAADPDGADNVWTTADDGLQPTAGSPAIDTGDPALLPADLADLDGDANTAEPLPLDLNLRPRIRGGLVDRGAYEPLVPLIYHVRVGGTGSGFTWATAMGHPQAAIDAAYAASNSQVWVAEGTYLPVSWPNGGSAEREKHFALRDGVPVYGAFHDSGDPGLAERNPLLHPTVFSGDLEADGNNTNNAYHVFNNGFNTLGSATRLDSVTITGANADGTGGQRYGGGMYGSGGSPTLVRCLFLANHAAEQAGGLYLGSSNSHVVNCVFSGNSASSQGGAVYLYQSMATLSNCLFAGNTAPNGGAVYLYQGGPSVFHSCTFSGNAAAAGNHTVYVSSSSAILNNSILWGNPNGGIAPAAFATLNSCIIEGGWGGLGSGNLASDPLFANATDPDGPDNLWATIDDGLNPTAESPAINSANPVLLPPDTTDLDGDSNTTEILPLDLAMQPRVRGTLPDRGAYETTTLLIYHVRVGGSGNGLTWATSTGDVQAAIEACVSEGNSQVWIAAGTYYPTSSPNGGILPRERHFALRNGVAVYGGFPATGNPGFPTRDPAVTPTILSGDVGALGNENDNAYHVFYHPSTDLDPTARLDGVTITGGNADGTSAHARGAGMYNYTASPTLVRCRFLENRATSQGGGLYLRRCDSTIVGCVFSGNSADSGGAAYVYDDDPAWADCVITENQATSGAAFFFLTKGRAVLSHCTIYDNKCTGTGGAVHNDSSRPTLDNSILWANTPAQASGLDMILHSCVIQDGWGGAGSGNLSSNPLFFNAADPDGPDNRWATADDGLRLALPSPAINGGNPALLPADAADLDNDGNRTEPLPLDVIGLNRSLDGIPEIGAYEYQSTGWSLAFWRTLHFSAADRADPAKEATVWGNNADPDGDGVPNSGEYLLRLNPNACDSPLANLPVVERFGANWLRLVYTEAKDRPGVSLFTQVSTTLASGSWGSTSGFPLTILEETATTRTIELLIPMAPEPRRFLRMGFSAP